MQSYIFNGDSERTAPNCEFIIDNAESPWPEEMYDFVHQRNMTGHISDWAKLFRQAFDHLNPGGYYEIQEFDMPWDSHRDILGDDSAILRWYRHIIEAGQLIGRQFIVAAQFQEKLVQAGFEGVKRDVYKVSNDSGGDTCTRPPRPPAYRGPAGAGGNVGEKQDPEGNWRLSAAPYPRSDRASHPCPVYTRPGVDRGGNAGALGDGEA
jgi:Methyltransferase domain